jgi:hypothetical protein
VASTKTKYYRKVGMTINEDYAIEHDLIPQNLKKNGHKLLCGKEVGTCSACLLPKKSPAWSLPLRSHGVAFG